MLVAISFSATSPRSFHPRQPTCLRLSTAPFMVTHPSYNLFCPRALKPKPARFFIAQKMQRLSVSHCSNLDTLKNPRQYRASPKTNMSSIGVKAATISRIISPSIIPGLTIASCAPGIWLTYTDQLPCEGVLNLPRNPFPGYTQIPTTDKPYCLPVALLSTNNLTRLHRYDHLPTHLAAAFRGLPLTSSSLGLTSFHQYKNRFLDFFRFQKVTWMIRR